MYLDLPLRENNYFWVPHTSAEQVIVSNVLQCAAVTLGHPDAIPNTTFIRKLFATHTAAGEIQDECVWEKAIKDLAKIDAHSARVAMSVHYNLSDRIKGGVIKKSVRAFFNIMKEMPIPFPEEALDDAEFHALLSNMGKRGVKRRLPEAEIDGAALLDEEIARRDRLARREQESARIRSYGSEMLAAWKTTTYKNWMFHQIAWDLWSEDVHVSYFRVRYELKEKPLREARAAQ